MKIITLYPTGLIAIMLFTFSHLAYAQAQIDTTVLQFAKLPDSTGFGTPDGKLVSKDIGVDGGTIASDDGRVELLFPEGALLTNTTISIQPITNPLFSGTGKAYQFEPSGIQFKKPVQIVFQYTKEESETCPADLMNIAMQDHTGKWSFGNYEEWDSTEKTLKGFIHHFSSFANSNGSMIRPEKEMTIVEGSVNIKFYDRYGTVQSPITTNNGRVEVRSRYWAVNDEREGNAQFGYVGPQRLSTAMGVYTAPKIIPKRRNPVVISFYFEYYSVILEQYIWGVVSCRITVFDKYKVEVTHVKTGRASMSSELTDKGSFVLTIWPREKFDIDDIKNYPPTVIREGRNGPFKEKVITEGAEGSINLTASIKNKSLSEDYPPKVHLEFTPQHSLMCRLQYRGRGTGNSEPTMVFTTAIPEEIKFIANGQAQEYIIDIGHLDDEDKTYKLVITPHRIEPPK